MDAIAAPPALPEGDALANPLDALKWGRSFWDEPLDAGDQRIRMDLLIFGAVVGLAGHYSQGKTALAVDIARRWARELGPVVWFDYEMGRRRLKRRMHDNRWTHDDLERWHYDYMPAMGEGYLSQIAALAGDNLLIVVDSLAAALMHSGRDENSATEAGGLMLAELQRARDDYEATVLVLDQVKQSATSWDRYVTRGTGAKAFNVDVSWFVERFEKFTPDRQGLIRLSNHKDRDGVLPEQLAYYVGDGAGHLDITRTEPPEGPPPDPEAVDKVRDALAEADGPLSSDSIRRHKTEGLGDGRVIAALRSLQRQGLVSQQDRKWVWHSRAQHLDTPSID